MSEERIKYLFQRHYTGVPSIEERKELMDLLQNVNEDTVKQLMDDSWQHTGDEPVFTDRQRDLMLDNILEEKGARIHFMQGAWIKYAAAVIVLLGGAALWLFSGKSVLPPQNNTVKYTSDVKAGDDRATITLADGSLVVLDKSVIGKVARQGSFQIMQMKKGVLAYNLNTPANSNTTTVPYNTITTPKGGQYQVVLSDGTSVWLNAASSIRFPAMFTGPQRNVTITGEVYLEVATDNKRPFIVKTGNTDIQVLGTSFNINAYDDEDAIKTTLLTGRVKVTNGGAYTLLKPGRQAITPKQALLKSGMQLESADADTEAVMSWKNGRFQFEGADAGQVMRQIARWYNVEIVYKEAPGNLHFRGKINRSKNLSEVLKMLELTKTIHFDIKGDKVIVNP